MGRLPKLALLTGRGGLVGLRRCRVGVMGGCCEVRQSDVDVMLAFTFEMEGPPGSPVAVRGPEDRDVVWVSQGVALGGLCDSQSAGGLGSLLEEQGRGALGASEVQRGGGMAVETWEPAVTWAEVAVRRVGLLGCIAVPARPRRCPPVQGCAQWARTPFGVAGHGSHGVSVVTVRLCGHAECGWAAGWG